MRTVKILPAAMLILFSLAAEAQFKGYTYARKIIPVTENSYYSVFLDPVVLSRSQSSFSDYRVFRTADGDTTDVPCLFKWQDDLNETFYSTGKIIDRNFNEGGMQYLTLEFPGTSRVNQLELEITESNFDKLVKIECSNDNKEWKTIAARLRIVGLNRWGAYYRWTTLSFDESSYRYFRLTVSNVKWSPYKGHTGNISITGVKSTLNKCLSGSYKKIEGAIISEKEYRYDPSEKNDTVIYRAFNQRPPHPKAVHARRDDFRDPLNPTVISVRLPYAAYLHHIKLIRKDTGDFYRLADIRVSEKLLSFDDETGYLVSGKIFSSVTDNVYSLDNSLGKYLLIKIFNYNDEALKGLSLEIYTQDARLICRLEKEKNYFLAYGKKDDYSPRYDMMYFQEKLPGVYTDVKFGEELKAAPALLHTREALIKNKAWLWAVMGVLIIFIGFFAMKLMKKQEDR